jgi:diacylglycerol O-acyltransferase
MDKLSPLDALFIDAEDRDQHTSMAIASIAVFEGPCPSHEEVVAHLVGRLPLVPRYRQKLRTVPLRLGRPVWVDDPDFDIRYHVRRTALPAPGGDQQLAALMARVMSQRLDRDHPLWEYWVIEGLAHDHWAPDFKDSPLHGGRHRGHRPVPRDLRLHPRTFAPYRR